MSNPFIIKRLLYNVYDTHFIYSRFSFFFLLFWPLRMGYIGKTQRWWPWIKLLDINGLLYVKKCRPFHQIYNGKITKLTIYFKIRPAFEFQSYHYPYTNLLWVNKTGRFSQPWNVYPCFSNSQGTDTEWKLVFTRKHVKQSIFLPCGNNTLCG